MSLILIHGEQTHLSRKKLVEVVQDVKGRGGEVVTLNARSLYPPELETVLGGSPLFKAERLVVIEELHSLPVSARRKTLIEMVKSATENLLLWEKRSLTKLQAQGFKPNQAFEFKPTSSIFQWLDSLSPEKTAKAQQLKLLHKAIDNDGAEMCFALLARQVRLLIQAKTGAKIAGAPFMITKLNHQAQNFSLDQLLKLHHDLLNLDLKQKTSRTLWSLRDELDLLVVRM